MRHRITVSALKTWKPCCYRGCLFRILIFRVLILLLRNYATIRQRGSLHTAVTCF